MYVAWSGWTDSCTLGSAHPLRLLFPLALLRRGCLARTLAVHALVAVSAPPQGRSPSLCAGFQRLPCVFWLTNPLRRADIKEELKAAGFGLAFRKSIAEMPELATLTKALEANLGFTLKVDWKSMVGSDDDETVKVVRVLKEAVFAGLASDVSTLGTDELGALAADSASKCLEVARGTENSVGWTGADKHLKLTFKLGDNVTYPSKGLDVRDFVLNNTGGADDPAAVLPKGGLGKKCTPNKKCEVVFKGTSGLARCAHSVSSLLASFSAPARDWGQQGVDSPALHAGPQEGLHAHRHHIRVHHCCARQRGQHRDHRHVQWCHVPDPRRVRDGARFHQGGEPDPLSNELFPSAGGCLDPRRSVRACHWLRGCAGSGHRASAGGCQPFRVDGPATGVDPGWRPGLWIASALRPARGIACVDRVREKPFGHRRGVHAGRGPGCVGRVCGARHGSRGEVSRLALGVPVCDRPSRQHRHFRALFNDAAHLAHTDGKHVQAVPRVARGTGAVA